MALELWMFFWRAVCLLFSAVAFAVIIKAPNMNDFTLFQYLTVAFGVQMVWNVIRLLFQVACLWFGRAQPTNTALIVFIILELVLSMSTTMTAGWSGLGVVVYLDLDLSDCSSLSDPSACPVYYIASTLGVTVGIVSILITLGMQSILVFRYHFNTVSA